MSRTKVSMAELELARQFIALEGVNEFHATSNALSKFTEMTKKTVSFVKETMSGVSAYFSGKKETFELYRKFATETKYGDVNKVTLQVPEGFQGNLKDYTDELLQANEIVSTLIKDLILPFDTYVSQLVNNPSLLSSVTFTHKVNVKDVEKQVKLVGKFLSGKKHATLELGKVYQRNKDIEDNARLLENLYNYHSSSNVEKIKIAVNRLDDNLLKLVDIMSSPNSNYGEISAKTIETLASLSFDLAKHVEFTAAINAMTSALIHCSQVNQDTFKSFLKNR